MSVLNDNYLQEPLHVCLDVEVKQAEEVEEVEEVWRRCGGGVEEVWFQQWQ